VRTSAVSARLGVGKPVGPHETPSSPEPALGRPARISGSSSPAWRRAFRGLWRVGFPVPSRTGHGASCLTPHYSAARHPNTGGELRGCAKANDGGRDHCQIGAMAVYADGSAALGICVARGPTTHGMVSITRRRNGLTRIEPDQRRGVRAGITGEGKMRYGW
jgi:hypothetical protein